MNADIIPTEIAMVLLFELLFGIGYNALVALWNKHKLVHVSIEVAIGVAGALLIPIVFWFDYWEFIVILILCFVACGLPMIVGSMTRTVKDNKKRKPLPNTAAKVRDEAVMDLNTLADDIAIKAKDDQLRVQDLPYYVNVLHSVIGMLKSL